MWGKERKNKGRDIILSIVCVQRKKNELVFFDVLSINFFSDFTQGHRLPIAQVFFKKLGYNVVMLSYRG